ncbi:hypothetical protein F5Y00DRAFT_245687 [Daldinia vernicosa]|uniref:uncharacterized protein n=1 Tax=Daldinia vernicosa TaxID=114800 RepID=UPI0020088DB6|nr:uncharacterized protein F5Y00DRAFT_245687 [Daldinia vernicosa]KAI0845644.1 hypothetical protein F5Y00DRAFT_245687 [Daldinia vernicosa]
MSSLKTFTLFPRLPPEIRLAIWNLSIVACLSDPAICVYRPAVLIRSSERVFPTSREISLPMPVFMQICQESRSAMQKSTIAVFDIDQNGAWLNSRRKFCPDVDILCVGFFELFCITGHNAIRFIGPNVHRSVQREQSLTDCKQGPLRCGACDDSRNGFRSRLFAKIWHLNETVPMGLRGAPELLFLFCPVAKEHGSARRTAILSVTALPKSCLFKKMSRDPTLIIGGDDSEWQFAVPDFEFFVLPRGRWPA